MQTYNPSVSYAAGTTKARLRMPQALLRCPYTGEPNVVSANLQPLSQLRCQLYQGTPTEASADLQPLSQLALTAPLTQGSLCGECKLTPSVSYAAGTTKARLRMPQALLQCPYTGEPIEVGADRHRQKNLTLDK